MSSPQISSLPEKIRKADRLLREYVWLRDAGVCQRCRCWVSRDGYGRPGECAHNMRRGHNSTRCDPRNVALLCQGCHEAITASYTLHVEFFVGWSGQIVCDLLTRRANTPVQSSHQFWDNTIADLRARIDMFVPAPSPTFSGEF